MKRVKIGQGKATIEFDDTVRQLVLETLRQAEPIMMMILETEVENLKNHSEKNWLVRQKKYGRSKNSKGQHETGVRIIPPSTIQAFVSNTAPYAYAIRVSPTSDSSLPVGKRLADLVLWTPAKKNIDRITLEIAKQTARALKKVV